MKNSTNIYRETEPLVDNAATVTIALDANALTHQITIETAGVVTTGTATIGVKAEGASGYTLLRDATDAVLSLDLTAAPYTLRFSGRFTSLQVIPDTYDGSTYSVTVMGW